MTQTSYWIREKGYAKVEDTSCERFVRKILEEMDVAFLNDLKVDFLVSRKGYTSNYAMIRYAIEVQGPYHETQLQRRKTKWRTELLNASGFHVILVPWQLCIEKYRNYLKAELVAGIHSESFLKEIVS